jgi:hypothetical protein
MTNRHQGIGTKTSLTESELQLCGFIFKVEIKVVLFVESQCTLAWGNAAVMVIQGIFS